MAKTLYKYEASSNKFVWFTTWDRALRNYYTDDYNYVPDPVVGNPYNTFVEFRSRKPGMANVDWGGWNKGAVSYDQGSRAELLLYYIPFFSDTT